MSNTFPDRILIEARDSSFRLEKLAIAELRANIDGYLAPNLRARTMIDDWDQFAGNGGFATEEQYRNFRYACEETRMQSNSVFSRVLSKHIPVSRPNMADTMFDGLVTKPDVKSNSKVLVNGEDEIEESSDAWTKIIDAGYRNLEAYGWWKVPVLAPPAIVKSLRAKIEKQLAASHGQEAIDATIAGKEGAKLAHWINSGHASTYEELYQLSSDPLLFSIVQQYMGVPPIFNTPVSVLSGPVKIKATKEMEGTGQLYHYDMHRLKFVKMFIYLTDVGAGSGPHTLIKRTHRNRPESLWVDRRYTDEEMVQAGVKKDEVSISGKAGTVFLVDTSAYHKGAHPETDYRIMAQVQYTNSLFGKPIAASDHKVERAMKSKNEVLQDAAALVRKYAERTGVRFMQNYI